MELLGEDSDLGHELDLVVSQLNELVHHTGALLLSLLAALTGTFSVFQLPIIFFRKIFSHFQDFLFRNLLDVDDESADIDYVAQFLFHIVFLIVNVISSFTFI